MARAVFKVGVYGFKPPPPEMLEIFFSLYKYANLLNASIVALAELRLGTYMR